MHATNGAFLPGKSCIKLKKIRIKPVSNKFIVAPRTAEKTAFVFLFQPDKSAFKRKFCKKFMRTVMGKKQIVLICPFKVTV